MAHAALQSTTAAGPARALLLMLAAMASFVANDTLVKTVIDDLPLGEIIVVRGIMAAAFIGLIARAQGVAVRLPALMTKVVLLRAGLDSIGTMLFLAALVAMPIANLTAVMQAVPLIVTLIGMLFLGERVGWRRMLAITIGFCGVLLVVKPAATGPTLYELCALGVVFAVAIRDVVTRRIPAGIPSIAIALVNAAVVTLAGVAMLAFQDLLPLSPGQFMRLAGAAVFLATGYMCMVATLRAAQLSATAPARYSIIVFAILSGIVFFGEIPDRWAFLGIALIVASGLYAIYRERRQSTQP